MANSIDQTLKTLNSRIAGTGYVLEPTAQGFKVRMNIEDSAWAVRFAGQGITRYTEIIVTLEPDGSVAKMSQRDGEMTYQYGPDGSVLHASFSGSFTQGKSMSYSKSVEFSRSSGKIVHNDPGLPGRELRDLVKSTLSETGWTVKDGACVSIGVFAAVFGAIIALIATVGGLVIALVAR